ncbi:putative reverse transcriptase domain-containing protein [Tanacetum coccineum]
MVNARHKEVLKASTSKGAKRSASDVKHDDRDNGSSSSSEDLSFRGFTDEEIKVLSLIIRKQVGKTIKNVMPYYISQTTDNLKEIACDVPKFDGVLDPIASTRWIAAVEGAFRTSNRKEKNKERVHGNNFKELFNAEFTSAKEIDRIQEEFQTLTQTSKTVNEMWKKFNDLIRYCPEYHGNEKLKVERFQRMLRDDIIEVISPFKCTSLDDILSRAWVREADLLRKKSKEAKETKRKLESRNRDAKKPKQDHNRRSGGTQIKTPCKKNHKTHFGVCQANLPGCYKCGALNHMSKDCKKPMILCYNFYQLGHKSNECPNPKVIEAKPLMSIKEEKVEKKKSIPPSSKLPFPLEVEIADSKVVVVSNMYRDVEIEIDDITFRIDLIPIMLGVFDIVIGMDWLDKYDANILCSQKLIRVVNPQGREIIIYGDKEKGEYKLCSVMKARRYLSRGFHAFMAHVIDTSFEKKSEKDVPIVNEFLDVFPEDLPDIPPERQVKFRIDLILGANPIAKTPYRLAPSEMKELMSQLQE